MTGNAVDKEIRQYLLGGLDEGARQTVERRLLTEEDFFEELLFAEEELTDQYLNEELSADERRSFESHFLSTPERRRKLSFAKALGRYVAAHSAGVRAVADEPRRSPAPGDAPTWAGRLRAFWGAQGRALRVGAAFAAAVFLVGSAWFLLRPPAPRTYVALSLSPAAVTRGEGGRAEAVKLSPDTDALKVTLTLPGGAAEGSRFEVELENEGGTVGRLEAERRDAQSISLEIPASRLAPARYALRVFEVGADGAGQRLPGSYLFNVE